MKRSWFRSRCLMGFINMHYVPYLDNRPYKLPVADGSPWSEKMIDGNAKVFDGRSGNISLITTFAKLARNFPGLVSWMEINYVTFFNGSLRFHTINWQLKKISVAFANLCGLSVQNKRIHEVEVARNSRPRASEIIALQIIAHLFSTFLL